MTTVSTPAKTNVTLGLCLDDYPQLAEWATDALSGDPVAVSDIHREVISHVVDVYELKGDYCVYITASFSGKVVKQVQHDSPFTMPVPRYVLTYDESKSHDLAVVLASHPEWLVVKCEISE